jgi:hypothetical protein
MGEPLASIIAVCALGYFNPVGKIGDEKIIKFAKFIEGKLSGIARKIYFMIMI